MGYALRQVILIYFLTPYPVKQRIHAARRKDWETFVRTKLPFRDMSHVDPIRPARVSRVICRHAIRHTSITDFAKHEAQLASGARII